MRLRARRERLAPLVGDTDDPKEHCVYCGRELVDVTERDSLHDRETGERRLIVWHQCPRYPRNGLMALLRGSCHESFQRENRFIAREYR